LPQAIRSDNGVPFDDVGESRWNGPIASFEARNEVPPGTADAVVIRGAEL